MYADFVVGGIMRWLLKKLLACVLYIERYIVIMKNYTVMNCPENDVIQTRYFNIW